MAPAPRATSVPEKNADLAGGKSKEEGGSRPRPRCPAAHPPSKHPGGGGFPPLTNRARPRAPRARRATRLSPLATTFSLPALTYHFTNPADLLTHGLMS